MLVLLNIIIEPSNLRKKINKGTTIYDKRIVKCDIGTTQCEDGTVKYEKKVRKPPNVRKELSHVMLELHNMRIKSSNVRKKKKREPHNVTKELTYLMLELHNVKMEPSNVRKK